MQKITVTAPTLNEALQEVKKRFGDDVVIQHTEEVNDEIRLTISLLDQKDAIILPSFKKSENIYRADNPLSAIRSVEYLCKNHNLGQDFEEAWLKHLSPYLVLPNINLAESFNECFHFDSQWLRKILHDRPVIFLGSFGCGKTQALAKVAALLKTADRDVEIYNMDTLKASGQGMLEAYAKKLEVSYYFGKEAWATLQENLKKKTPIIKLIDTPGLHLGNPKDLEWILPYLNRFTFEPLLVVPADGNGKQTNDYIKFMKKFHVKGLLFSKIDNSNHFSLPIRVAWISEMPITMFNMSPNLGENLKNASAQHLLEFLSKEPQDILTQPI